MIFKTEYKPNMEALSDVPENLLRDIIDRTIADELSQFIISKKSPEKNDNGIYKAELFITSKENWIKLRRLINVYGGANLPYELESLLLAMEQQ